MATTEIHAIRSTPDMALGYVIDNKIVAIKSVEEIHKGIPHEVFTLKEQLYVNYKTVTSFLNCNEANPYKTYREKQHKFKDKKYKNNGVTSKDGKVPLMWHLHQSFNGMETTPFVANEIGIKLANEIFKGFTVTVSTHGNTGNIHNHFIISAWNDSGKKWNNCNSNYRNIRAVSDRLCDEYGLHVLEKTRNVKLVKYEDKDGKIHFFEPTDRKNEIINKRSVGEATKDDVRSYRNTPQYGESEEQKKSNKSVIQIDIDTLLPTCRSYEELLERLKELGYTIRDKKKNGDWLSHVAFIAPTQTKATREDKIGDESFYVRKNLEEFIAKQGIEHENKSEILVNHGDDIMRPVCQYFSEYEYGTTKLEDVNDNYKVVKTDSEYKTIERTAIEKKVLSHIRIKDSQVSGLIDTTSLHKIIDEQKTQKRYKRPYLSATQEQRLVGQIQSSFRCLQFTEQHHIFSYKQIIDLYIASKNKYDTTIDGFTKAETAINQLKDIVNVPQKMEILMQKMESRRNDVAYVIEEYNMDKIEVERCKSIISKYKIGTPQGLSALESKIAEFETRQDINRGYMANVITQMAELENCIRTFDRIDTEQGNKNIKAMQQFESIVNPQAEQQNNEKKMKGRDER